MQVLISDPTYDHPNRDRGQFLVEVRTELRELSPKFDLTDADIGQGADWPVLLATLGGLFFLGKPINDNVEAWLALGKKVATFVRRVRERWGASRLDEHGCILLTISRITELHEGPIRSIDLIGTIPAHFQVLPLRNSKTLDHHPDALYVIGFRLNHECVYIFGVKSKGTIEFEHRFSISYLEF